MKKETKRKEQDPIPYNLYKDSGSGFCRDAFEIGWRRGEADRRSGAERMPEKNCVGFCQIHVHEAEMSGYTNGWLYATKRIIAL